MYILNRVVWLVVFVRIRTVWGFLLFFLCFTLIFCVERRTWAFWSCIRTWVFCVGLLTWIVCVCPRIWPFCIGLRPLVVWVGLRTWLFCVSLPLSVFWDGLHPWCSEWIFAYWFSELNFANGCSEFGFRWFRTWVFCVVHWSWVLCRSLELCILRWFWDTCILRWSWEHCCCLA